MIQLEVCESDRSSEERTCKSLGMSAGSRSTFRKWEGNDDEDED